MLYDHWLSLHWPQFHDEALPRFLQQSYRHLLVDADRLPNGLPLPLQRMAEQDWIASYQHKGAGTGPQRHRRRLRRPCRSAMRCSPQGGAMA